MPVKCYCRNIIAQANVNSVTFSLNMAIPKIEFIHGAGPRPEMPELPPEMSPPRPGIPQGAVTGGPLIRNPGVDFDRGWIDSIHVNLSAVERRIDSLSGRRTVKKAWQAAWLLKAVTCMDLTTLAGDDTPGRVLRLCAKARSPIRPDLIDALGVAERKLTVGAVCVYHAMVGTAVEALVGTAIPVAAVSTGFPAGHSPTPAKLAEIEASV